LNENGGLHFDLVGGADEGKFPLIGGQRLKPEEAAITVQSLSQNGKLYNGIQIALLGHLSDCLTL
jgi:hypothetical protein